MKPLPTDRLEAAVYRYLLAEGRPCDFASIRHGAELAKASRGDVWAALRALIERQEVCYAYRWEATTYEGFQQSMSYPVFWVNRDSLVPGGYPVEPTGPEQAWWQALVARATRQGVQP